jgi:type I restriction enzyme, S subunit
MVPDGWQLVKLGELTSSHSYGPRFSANNYDINGNVKTIRNTDITETGEILYEQVPTATLELQIIEQHQLKTGDLIVITTADCGLSAIFEEQDIPYIPSAYAVRYRLNQKILPPFAKYFMHTSIAQKQIETFIRKGTVANLPGSDVLKIQFTLPTLSEQKKIAEILSSVDEAIASTQAVIDQTRKVKQGLLQQLLTRNKYNKVEDTYNIAKYPLRLLDEVAQRVTGHTPNRKKPEYWDGEIKWVSLQDSAALDRVYINKTAAEISEEGIRNSSAVKHPKGTVVLSRDAGVGKSAITTDEMAVSQHFIGWICGSELNNHYLYYWLQHMKPVFERIAIGNTIKTIGMPFFKSLKIPVPPMEIQVQIANTLLSHDQQIFSAEEELEQLSIIKRGLMQDLLTGRIRVGAMP